jgi:hypothetical protein
MAVTKKKAKKKVAKKKATSKNKGGQPSKYKPEMNVTVQVMTAKGFIDKEITEAFGISRQTLKNWKKKYPAFLASLKEGKAIADGNVVRALYQRATGYSHPDVNISHHRGKAIITPTIKHYPPDVVACIYWTKNRMPEEWNDRKQLDIGGQKDNPLPPLTIIVKKYDDDTKPSE